MNLKIRIKNIALLYMPIHIRKVKGGYKVSDSKFHKFSYKPLSKARALKQLQAINISKHQFV